MEGTQEETRKEKSRDSDENCHTVLVFNAITDQCAASSRAIDIGRQSLAVSSPSINQSSLLLGTPSIPI